ncbi:unnamed protein product [Caenorhabditis auriculariae]|uniref:Transmembrane protein 231 n=1 Tax=Caenorhabditis auriculariae TaxID=2777116 RepID=A0A8S1HMD1_9PELO|nr:unnamed protein product [Caenorhabditis auriculariae]
MVHEEVFKEPQYRIYRAPSCSWASFYSTIINVLRIFLPVLIIFSTHGLWKKYDVYREVPRIEFEGRHVIWATTKTSSSFVASSFAVLNVASDDVRTTFISYFLVDDPSKKLQKLTIALRIHTGNDTLDLLNFQYFVNFKLDYNLVINAELLLTDCIHLTIPTSEAQITALLDVDQSQPFRGDENFELIDETRIDIDHYQPNAILERAMEQPIGLKLSRKSQVLLPTSQQSDYFKLSLNILIGEMEFKYKTNFWQLIKWAWIQYFAVYYVINHLLNSISSFLFSNHVFYTVDSANKL